MTLTAPPATTPSRSPTDNARHDRGPSTRTLVAGAILAASAPFLFLGGMLIAFAATGGPPSPASGNPSDTALADIPADYLAHYQQAGSTHGIDWAILAGIGKLECDHGRSQLAGCNPPGTTNSAGARGPMQFLGSTWRATAGQHDTNVAGPPIPEGEEHRGYATDADGDGTADPWTPLDAIHAAARYLQRNGAPGDNRQAIYAYNHADWYVDEVLQWADTYRDAAANTPSANQGPTGSLVDVPCPAGGTITVDRSLEDNLTALLTAAAADGVNLCGGGWRSTEQQIELRRQNCGTSNYDIYEAPSSACSPHTARPGTSSHELGTAVDFNNCSTRSTACYQWLAANAHQYDLRNYPPEPWHWSVDGT